ncbi:Protein FAM172A [Neolecta irregularis DAH-3]|uniref:Protein FAM172A n=1 Tax=Neolecta irregularis (strain DAH-3) TaxID=1198029 RepID=A0A1U7LKB1_NEOID|nr:Protein FAM172A [Neolecta irregularis DAH-3]|eukprot:OLL23079.1 Protein FAM172A [Neolecta irregularis DAH-3]
MFRRIPKKKTVIPVFPTTLEGHGYQYNPNSDKISMFGEPDSPYIYKRTNNELHNFRLKQQVNQHIQQIICEKLEALGLHPHTTIYCTPDINSNTEKLLVVIPESRIFGVWSDRALFDDTLNSGCVLQCIERAIKEGYSIVITNQEQLTWIRDLKKALSIPQCNALGLSHHALQVEIPGNETPQKHIQYVFEHFVLTAPAKAIYVLASGRATPILTDYLDKHCA